MNSYLTSHEEDKALYFRCLKLTTFTSYHHFSINLSWSNFIYRSIFSPYHLSNIDCILTWIPQWFSLHSRVFPIRLQLAPFIIHGSNMCLIHITIHHSYLNQIMISSNIYENYHSSSMVHENYDLLSMSMRTIIHGLTNIHINFHLWANKANISWLAWILSNFPLRPQPKHSYQFWELGHHLSIIQWTLIKTQNHIFTKILI